VASGAFGGLSDWQLILTGPTAEGPTSRSLRPVLAADLDACGLGYPDLVGAVDVVVTKPGYGIVSDCIGAGTRLVYTDRGDFPEYPILVAGMAEHLPVAFVSNEDLRAGRIREAVESVLAREVPAPPDLTGAERAAARILELAGTRRGAGRP
jgi:UDP:flavonoid glycosyltransferase YjiC (YdhE family)